MDKYWVYVDEDHDLGAQKDNKEGEWYKADDVEDLARRGLKYKNGHTNKCATKKHPVWKDCNCGWKEYIEELRQIVKEREDE